MSQNQFNQTSQQDISNLRDQKLYRPCLTMHNSRDDPPVELARGPDGSDGLYEIETISDCTVVHSASPLWDKLNETLYFIDRIENRIHRYQPESKYHDILSLPKEKKISFIALTESSNELLVGLGNSMMLVTIKNYKMIMDLNSAVRVSLNTFDLPNLKIETGKISPYGELIICCESVRNDGTEDTLYRVVAPKGKSSEGLRYSIVSAVGANKSPVAPSNLCWDHGGRSLYVTDAKAKALLRFVPIPFRSTLENKEEVINFSTLTEGAPTGVAVDANGYVWVTLDGTGELVCVDPSKGFGKGEIVNRIQLPSKHPTGCAFGGSRMEHLYVTSRAQTSLSRKNSKSPPLTTTLFRINLKGVHGANAAYAWKKIASAGQHTIKAALIMVGLAASVISFGSVNFAKNIENSK